MNYNNMYPNRMSDNIDPNYIYPQPYIDPLMYLNPYVINNSQFGNFNPNINPEYTTYSNKYADNPQFTPYEDIPNNNMNLELENGGNINNTNNEMSNIPIIPMVAPNMMLPGMFPPNMMFPGIAPNMMLPGMMFPGTVPSNMMYPGMIPNIPTVNMDEFDEEEM